MSYNEYLNRSKELSTQSGYFKAVNTLYYDRGFEGFQHYKNLIKISLEKASKGTDRRKLIAADICCGKTMWISRYFPNYCKTIYCVDKNKSALSVLPSSNCIAINKAVSNHIFPKNSLDYIYCGFGGAEEFIGDFHNMLKPKGCILISKVVYGDDIRFTDYSARKVLDRRRKISQMTKSIKNTFKNVRVARMSFGMTYKNPDTDKILAALEVAWKTKRLGQDQYSRFSKALKSRIKNNRLTIKQNGIIWIAVK